IQAFDEGQHGDHRHDADDGSEQRQERAHLVRAERAQSHARRLAQVHRAAAISDAGVRTSLSILPSRMRTTRRALAAISASWVTRITVLPCFQIRSKEAMISSPVTLSRLPVGSSARMMLG